MQCTSLFSRYLESCLQWLCFVFPALSATLVVTEVDTMGPRYPIKTCCLVTPTTWVVAALLYTLTISITPCGRHTMQQVAMFLLCPIMHHTRKLGCMVLWTHDAAKSQS